MILVSTPIWSIDYSFSVKHTDGIIYHCVVYIAFENTKHYEVYITYTDEYNNEYTGDIAIPKQIHYNNNTYLVTSIGAGAFKRCKGLQSVTIHEDVTHIGTDAFYDSPNLTEIIVDRQNQTYFSMDGVLYDISKKTLYYYPCGKDRDITIPDWVTIIGESAFSQCKKITKITIPNYIKTIQHFAFSNCISLSEIIIPESVTGIGFAALDGCSNLHSITCLADTPPTAPFSFANYNIPLFVPEKSIHMYREAETWSLFYNIHPIQLVNNEPIDRYQYKCFSFYNHIIIENLCFTVNVSIYSFSGQLIKKISNINRINIRVPSGIYMVKIDNKTYKVKV